jgi:hypothetical protein
VRLFAAVGVLMVVGAAFLFVDAGLRMQRCMATDTWSLRFWSTEFWLLVPKNPSHGLSQNAHWFMRAVGGLLALPIGLKVVKIATR